MKLKTIKNVWAEFNRDVFAAVGCPLSEVAHFRTRSTDIWAYWTGESYYWNNVDHSNMQALIFHEMIHQWQDEYISYLKDENPHDIYFWGWQPTARKLGLTFGEHL